jgi:hypothetical protein
MTTDSLKLRKIIAKTFRKAKRWYLAYLLFQLAILIFAVISIFAEFNPNLSAVIIFLAVFATEAFRWRSDYWKTEGEKALRMWEKADGLGIPIDHQYIADWLAGKPEKFLLDVCEADTQGQKFDNTEPPGVRRLLKNTQESAWWSKHLSSRMVIYLAVMLFFLVLAAFVTLCICIGSLKQAGGQAGIVAVQNVGGILCSLLAFVFSINAVRLLIEFARFAAEAKEILRRCGDLSHRADVAERDAIAVLHDYQTARNLAPLLPTFVWKFHSRHLNEQWADFRGEPDSKSNG